MHSAYKINNSYNFNANKLYCIRQEIDTNPQQHFDLI